jgi:DNA (cytosine-5)-methyltransferase 1
LIVDLFAGGGGASVGIEAATGRIVDLAINHSPVALAVHKANHPRTHHLSADIWAVVPKTAVGRRKVELLWASPDCTHFSVAKGGKPRESGNRSLAWVVVDWARDVRPDVICLENVREFLGWGPLDNDGKPVKAKMGETFAQWRGALELLGYKVDHRILDASLYGAPTKRRRLFLVARCDGKPIVWPETTHGPGKLPVHTVAECIDWSLPCPSIFERKRPLAEKTLWRIAQGIRRFVLENPTPFIVKVNHGDDHKTGTRVSSIDDPLTTITATSRSHALVVPVIAGVGGRAGQSAATGGADPIGTITAKNDRVLIAPTLVQTGYGERPAVGDAAAQRPRYLDLHAPMGTLMAEGVKQGLVSAFLVKHFGDPLRADGGGVVLGQELKQPVPTITTRDHSSLAAICLAKFRGTDPSQPASGSVEEPVPTISAGGIHVAEVRAFLTAFYGTDGTGGQSLNEPARTITSKHRLGLVTISGIDYQIVDIGMRMLESHELLAAQFGRFAADYDLSAATTKAAKVRLIGNSVCPEVAEAVVAANLPLKLRRTA